MPPEAGAVGSEPRDKPAPYAWYMLGVLLLVYVFNYVDRQLLTILAPDLKRDLGISDADFGFLYGTAFGLFYALFGIPLGKLADTWPRVRLLGLGMGLWSLMTALCGLSRSFAQLAAARIGVGIGEATASPCAFSLIADSFPPRRRTTAIGIYASGLFLGAGLSLFVGSSLSAWWTGAFPAGGAPLGLAGWQAAFVIVGLPGLAMAAWVATLREPPRGRYETTAPAAHAAVSPWPGFLGELASVIPPFTLLGAAQRGGAALAANLAAAGVVVAAAALLIWLTGDHAQWIALGIGAYAVFSWAMALRSGDREAFAVLFRSPVYVGVSLAYGLVSFVGYANLAFTPLYAIQELHAAMPVAGAIIGGLGAVGGMLGTLIGGLAADRVAARAESRRIVLLIVTAALALASHTAMFTASSLPLFYAGIFVAQFFASASLTGASGTVVQAIPARFRGTATAAFLMTTNMIGLALGPYTGGKLSALTGSLGMGMLSLLGVAPAIFALLAWSYAGLRGGEAR